MSTTKDGYIEVTNEEARLFPEHFGETVKSKKWYKRFFGGNPEDDKIKCEKNVINCIEKYPIAKIMLNALNKAGCNVDLRKHFSCEYCSDKVAGGYDAKNNKIIICYNQTKSEKTMTTAISHEMLHMYDYCRADFDYKNLEHVACSEIRAANIFHCGLKESLIDSSVFIFGWYKDFERCVKQRAIDTLVYGGRVDKKKANKIVDKVFDRCFADMEPTGRRFLHNIDDQQRCYRERHIYGYD